MKSALSTAACHLSVLSLLLLILPGDSLHWRLFIERYFNLSILRLIFAVSLCALFYLQREQFRAGIKTSLGKHIILLFTALAAFCFNFGGPGFLFAFYAAYAVLFFNQPPAENRILLNLLSIDSKRSALFALGMVLLVPVLVMFKKPGLAERAAIYAYCLLILTVVLQVMELRSHKSAAPTYRPFREILLELDQVRFPGLGLRLAVLGVLAGLLFGAKAYFWRQTLRSAEINPAYRSEVVILNGADQITTWPAFADRISIPVRLSHPVSKPHLWQESGDERVKIGVRWFEEGRVGNSGEHLFQEHYPLPRSLYLYESCEVPLQLVRPPLPAGKMYQLQVGLLDRHGWWSYKGDPLRSVRVRLDDVPKNEALAHETGVYGNLSKELEEEWGLKLNSQKDGYRSKIEWEGRSPFTSTFTVRVTNKGRLPWPIHVETPVRVGIVGVKTGNGSVAHVFERRFALPDVVLPGATAEVSVFFDESALPESDEVWIGMVHDGKTWFYSRGDSVLKIRAQDHEELERRAAALRNENLQMLNSIKKMRRQRILEYGEATGSPYRSRIRALGHDANAVVESEGAGLVLELDVTNFGTETWGHGRNPVNLGFLWFKSADAPFSYSKNVLEERGVFPSEVLNGTTVRLRCTIGYLLGPGDYQLWIGPVKEGVTWFFDQGDEVLKLNVVFK